MWLKGRRAGYLAGCADKKGYWIIKIDGRIYFAHRLAWLYVHGEWPDSDLDHVDRDPANNRIENLRPCNKSLNAANQRGRGRVGLKGVTLVKSTGRYVARIQTRTLGTYDTPEEAHEAYCKAADETYGEYARH